MQQAKDISLPALRDGLDLFLEMIIPSLTRQNFCLHQGSNALFKEKRVSLCSFDQKLLKGLKPVVIPQN